MAPDGSIPDFALSMKVWYRPGRPPAYVISVFAVFHETTSVPVARRFRLRRVGRCRCSRSWLDRGSRPVATVVARQGPRRPSGGADPEPRGETRLPERGPGVPAEPAHASRRERGFSAPRLFQN